MNAREVALTALCAFERQRVWSDGALKRQMADAGLDGRDSALCTQLCLGVLQNRLLLDFYLGKFSNILLGRMERKVLISLRLGAYQMLFLDRVPHAAAVDSSVELARAFSRNPRTAGMVNAILRNFQRSLHHLPVIPRDDEETYLSILYSHPKWLVREYMNAFGTGTAVELLKSNNAQPLLAAQVNTLKTSVEHLEASLSEAGVGCTPHPWLENCLLLTHTGNLEELTAFQEGLFYIQDPASRLAVIAAGLNGDMAVLDACAAPGGKSFAAAMEMGGAGEILSCDIHARKCSLISQGARRLGLSLIRTRITDAGTFRQEWEGHYDCVLVDAPCSGLGVIAKKPDIRYKEPDTLKNLPEIQGEILDNSCRYVKEGGTLLYSTCTLMERENTPVVEGFLKRHPAFTLEPFTLPGPAGRVDSGMITLLPHVHGTDGFFIARLKRGERRSCTI